MHLMYISKALGSAAAAAAAAAEEGSKFRGANELRRKNFYGKKLNPMEENEGGFSS